MQPQGVAPWGSFLCQTLGCDRKRIFFFKLPQTEHVNQFAVVNGQGDLDYIQVLWKEFRNKRIIGSIETMIARTAEDSSGNVV